MKCSFIYMGKNPHWWGFAFFSELPLDSIIIAIPPKDTAMFLVLGRTYHTPCNPLFQKETAALKFSFQNRCLTAHILFWGMNTLPPQQRFFYSRWTVCTLQRKYQSNKLSCISARFCSNEFKNSNIFLLSCKIPW